MSEKRFKKGINFSCVDTKTRKSYWYACNLCGLLNEQQEFIEELQVSDEMGWKRAEMFEKKCPKELHNKKMYIKRLEYKVQKFKEMNGEQQANINRLEAENEQLKRQNKALKENSLVDGYFKYIQSITISNRSQNSGGKR